MSPKPETAPAASSRPRNNALRLALWLPLALIALLLAGTAAVWSWAATPGSLAQALAWTERWAQGRADTVGQWQTEGVQGSLRGGGRIESLRWQQGALSVQAEGVTLDWGDTLWTDVLLGRGLHPKALSIRALRVNDQRAPSPSEPMEALELPMPVSLAFRLDQFELSGKTAMELKDIRGHYRYGALVGVEDKPNFPALPEIPGLQTAHQLQLDALQLADGQYRAQLTLGAQTPMPLALDLQGDIHSALPEGANLHLAALAQVRGTLGGAGAALDISAEARDASSTNANGSTPAPFSLTARVMPWASQALASADLDTQALNLAALWPGAPASALSGRLAVRPDGDGWRADVALDNSRVGPADLGGLPLQNLTAQVRQNGQRWTVSDLSARLGGGALQGQGAFTLNPSSGGSTVSQWQGKIQAQNIRPALLWSTLAPGALDGQFSAEAAPDAQAPHALDLRISVSPSARQPAGATLQELRLSEVSLQGQWRPETASPTQGVLELLKGRIAMAGAQLEAKGRLDSLQRTWDGQWSLQVPGAQLSLQGQLAHAKGEGQAQIQLEDAARVLGWARGLQTLPLVGERVRSAMESMADWRVEGSGRSDIGWTGGLGALGWPMPPGTQAPMESATPRLQASLSLPLLRIQTADEPATQITGLSLQANGPLNALQLQLEGSANAAAGQARLSAVGRSTLAAGAGRLDLSRLTLRLAPQASTTAAPAWVLQNSQPLRLSWTQSATDGLSLDAGSGLVQLSLQGAATGLTPLAFSWQRLVWQEQHLETQGQMQGLSLPWINALSALGPSAGPGVIAANGLDGDLVFDAEWNLHMPADTRLPLALSATLQRRSGDIRWQNNGQTARDPSVGNLTAGIQDARLSIRVQDRQVQALVRWDTERLGQASADLTSPLNPGSAPADASALDRWWPASTPVRGNATVRLPQVGVWSILAPPGWRMSGSLTADASLSGTRGNPEWRGSLQGEGLSLRSVVDGIAFGNGQLRATLTGERLRVDSLSLQGPGGSASGGSLDVSGSAEWRAVPGSLLRQPFIELQARAQRLRLSDRADRRLTLSGDVRANLAGPQLQLRGQLKADSALIILPDEMAPSLDADVVLRKTRTLITETAQPRRVEPDVSVILDLGPQFEVRGQGLQTRLEGQLTVQASPQQPTPRLLGEVRAIQGSYRAYGQQLSIEAGVLRFTGPYDDPALDIRAVRKLPENTQQRVGVVITGNAQAPRVGLFAEPDLPDGDKLAWLVLGRPASAAGAQAFVLQQAARRLLSRGGEPLDAKLAQSLGLDEIGFASTGLSADGTTTDAALTLGKRLSSDLYLSYQQSVTGAMSTVSILYDISRRLTLRARAGTENAVDLIFTHRYD